MRSANINFRRFFLISVSLLGLGLIAGCLKVGLGDPEQAKVDDKLVGIWKTDGDEKTITVVNKFDSRAYVISSYDYDKDRDIYKPTQECYKAWLAKVGNTQFITLQFLGAEAASGKDPVFVVAKIVYDGNKVSIWPVKDDFAKDIATSEALTKLLSDNLNNANAFGQDPEVYNRITSEEFQKLLGEDKKK